MMKTVKTILMTIFLLVFSSTSFAWFSQPQNIGHFRRDNNRDTGIHFEKGADNQGTKHYSKVRKAFTDGYSKGIAKFDNGKLSVFYNLPAWMENCKIGEKGNMIDSVISDGNTLYKITNETNRTFYLMVIGENVETNFVLFGKLPNGKFAKYVDSKNINMAYFGTQLVTYRDVAVSGDSISISFSCFRKGSTESGKIVLPWSESAQWFGIDVAYD